MFALYHCVLDLGSFVFDVTGTYSQKVALGLRRDFGPLNDVETVKIIQIPEVGLNVFPIMNDHEPLGAGV